MKRSNLIVILVFVMLGCSKKEDVSPVGTSIQFSIATSGTTFELNDNLIVTVTRIGNFDFNTEANVYFYISKDNSYSSDDISINSSSSSNPVIFTGNQGVNFTVEISSNNLQSGNYYLIAKLQPTSNPSASVRFCNTSISVVNPESKITLTGISFYSDSYHSTVDTSTFFT